MTPVVVDSPARLHRAPQPLARAPVNGDPERAAAYLTVAGHLLGYIQFIKLHRSGLPASGALHLDDVGHR